MNNLIKNILTTLLLILGASQTSAEQKITFYHYNLLGSPVVTTDENGDVTWREEYSPWGEKLLKEDEAHDNVRGYTGHVNDKETGLTYMQARYYDPQIGRFMGVDPVGFQENNPISFNRYGYANNNPYKFTDPNGEMPGYSLPSDYFSSGQVVKDMANRDVAMGAMALATVMTAGALGPEMAVAFDIGLMGATGEIGGLSRSPTRAVEKNFLGKQSRQQRLKDLVNDDKTSSANRGWIKQEMNEVSRGKKGHLKNPPGKDLAHERGRENAKGYGYEHAHLQNRKDHRTQHKLDNFGKNNKDRDLNSDTDAIGDISDSF